MTCVRQCFGLKTERGRNNKMLFGLRSFMAVVSLHTFQYRAIDTPQNTNVDNMRSL